MNTVNFAELNLTEQAAPKPVTIKFNNTSIEVKQWLPIMDKYNLIMITLQEAEEGGIYNEVKLDMYLALNIIYKYSNITFTAEDRVNADETFDKLNASGLLAEIIKTIPEKEYSIIVDYVQTMRDRKMQYGNNFTALVKAFIEDMPRNAEYAKELIESFDKEKYQEVIDFAMAANGSRPIIAEKSVGQN